MGNIRRTPEVRALFEHALRHVHFAGKNKHLFDYRVSLQAVDLIAHAGFVDIQQPGGVSCFWILAQSQAAHTGRRYIRVCCPPPRDLFSRDAFYQCGRVKAPLRGFSYNPLVLAFEIGEYVGAVGGRHMRARIASWQISIIALAVGHVADGQRAGQNKYFFIII